MGGVLLLFQKNDANDCLQFFAESMQEIAENRKYIDLQKSI